MGEEAALAGFQFRDIDETIACVDGVVNRALAFRERVCVRIRARGALGPAGARAEEVPEDQAQQGQQNDRHDPDELLLTGSRALHNIDNRPYVADEHEEAQEAVVSKSKHVCFLQ